MISLINFATIIGLLVCIVVVCFIIAVIVELIISLIKATTIINPISFDRKEFCKYLRDSFGLRDN